MGFVLFVLLTQHYLCCCLATRESEYAAWTLVNGYALNHATIATHRLESDIRSINKFNKFVEDNGFKLNSEGGTLKGLFHPGYVKVVSGSLFFVIITHNYNPGNYTENLDCI